MGQIFYAPLTSYPTLNLMISQWKQLIRKAFELINIMSNHKILIIYVIKISYYWKAVICQSMSHDYKRSDRVMCQRLMECSIFNTGFWLDFITDAFHGAGQTCPNKALVFTDGFWWAFVCLWVFFIMLHWCVFSQHRLLCFVLVHHLRFSSVFCKYFISHDLT